MNRQTTPIDITNIPELVRLAEEVNDTKKPRVLTASSKTLAVLMPVGEFTEKKEARKTAKTNYEAFKAAAGGWKDIDTDALLKNIYATRRRSNRPLVEL